MRYTKKSSILLRFINPLVLIITTITIINSCKEKPQENYSNCTKCHNNALKELKSHRNIKCTECHIYRTKDKNSKEHPMVIKNPGDYRWVRQTCGKCHKNEVEGFLRSNHFLLKNCINTTTKLWNGHTYKNGILDIKKINIDIEKNLDNPGQLVVDFLKRSCLRCHFLNNGENYGDLKRYSGCSSCHTKYNTHKIEVPKDSETCLKCHNRNRVGIDYIGLWEQDYLKDLHTPYPNDRIYGSFYHEFQVDIHNKYGMTCIDCHKKEHTMYSKNPPKCENCHGGFKETKKIHIFKTVKGKELIPKEFNNKIIPHKKFHKNVSCSACHSLWSFQDYGLFTILDLSKSLYWDFEDRSFFGSYELHKFIEEEAKKEYSYQQSPPISRDWVSMKLKKGIWYIGFLERRFETPPIEYYKGKYYVTRPLYQYFITTKDKNGTVILNNIKLKWKTIPYVPHTIQKTGRECLSCHMNPKATGTFKNSKLLIFKLLNYRSNPIPPKKLKKIMNKTFLFKKYYSQWIKNRLLKEFHLLYRSK